MKKTNIKKIFKIFIKLLTPYGLIYLKRKKHPDKELQFHLDTNFKITGWMEPAHIKIRLDPKDWIQGRIIREGGYEKEYITKVKNIFPEGGIFFDIGANIGVYSLNLCRKAGEVYAFEATKDTYQLFQEIILENKIKNIHLYLNAIHNTNKEEVKIYKNDNLNIGSNSMHLGGSIANTAKTMSIDTFVKENHILQIDFIKMDIEGNELNALKGARESIIKFRPIIMCEINPSVNSSSGYTADDLYEYLTNELKYTPKKLRRNSLIKISRNEAIICQQNIFFFPSQR
jgi:FkbM family methyltransferase